jgi:hypothetical protein
MSILSKNKAPATPVAAYRAPTFNVDSCRQEIANIGGALGRWRQERDHLAAQPAQDWAANILRRARQRELDEYIAEGEQKLAELTSRAESEDDLQAAERVRLEELIEAEIAAVAAESLQRQERLDDLRLWVHAHNAAGGQRQFSAMYQELEDANVQVGSATGRLMATMTSEGVKRLVKVSK